MKMFAILVSDNHDELQWIKVGAYFDIRTRQYQPVGGRAVRWQAHAIVDLDNGDILKSRWDISYLTDPSFLNVLRRLRETDVHDSQVARRFKCFASYQLHNIPLKRAQYVDYSAPDVIQVKL